eukprot:1195746-Prorocentrum_minimum.AAC.4
MEARCPLLETKYAVFLPHLSQTTQAQGKEDRGCSGLSISCGCGGGWFPRVNAKPHSVSVRAPTTIPRAKQPIYTTYTMPKLVHLSPSYV